MNLAKKILATTLVPFVIFAVVVQVTTNYFTKANFEKVLSQFSTSMNQMKEQTTADFMKISEQLARDLIKEMKIGAGDSLQPGESIKFQHLADKQGQLDQLKEFCCSTERTERFNCRRMPAAPTVRFPLTCWKKRRKRENLLFAAPLNPIKRCVFMNRWWQTAILCA